LAGTSSSSELDEDEESLESEFEVPSLASELYSTSADPTLASTGVTCGVALLLVGSDTDTGASDDA
jgi:hypothetical protein